MGEIKRQKENAVLNELKPRWKIIMKVLRNGRGNHCNTCTRRRVERTLVTGRGERWSMQSAWEIGTDENRRRTGNEFQDGRRRKEMKFRGTRRRWCRSEDKRRIDRGRGGESARKHDVERRGRKKSWKRISLGVSRSDILEGFRGLAVRGDGDSTLSPDERFRGAIVNYDRHRSSVQTQAPVAFWSSLLRNCFVI